MMNIFLSLGATLVLTWLSGTRGEAVPELVLDERVLSISLVAANLSVLAYKNAADYAVVDAEGKFAHPDYEEITFYQEEPDQAVVAKKEGRCYLAFRGTTGNAADWLQNFRLGSSNVCKDNGPETDSECCETRSGYTEFLVRAPAVQASADLVTCLDSVCTDENKDDCLVITGHSQGGALATVASVALYSRLPTVITFGQPPAMDKDCDFIPSERFYRYVNSMKEIGENDDIGFDLISFSPSTWSNSVHYGYYILVGEDPTAVKYLGFDEAYEFTPAQADWQKDAHSMNGKPYSYQTRMSNLVSNIPNVTTNGFSEGSSCESGRYGYQQLCESAICENYQCLSMDGVKTINDRNGGLDGASCAFIAGLNLACVFLAIAVL
mmetsp:Transcript_22878/g.49498  ORF Transcript_22878/g.49498 Transcript_22878/m.49498 type:complete len:380 (+) Transcript_22878:401-1540(+)|eukprot:CAMPEP_0172308908 /NCGR_PEP_ID=MMETSP1058-20130122/9365_1 /TAXON_ID=83371 /ORGANISM="Detonula confervacea, Strain CCMP 353" /LENGTH=379 /DNA_ID=CAMNT_0013021435 /DNA_START=303 /DNA_END=1442 /DNA_ORIENTATION=-